MSEAIGDSPKSSLAATSVRVVDHPLIRHKLTIMRDKKTSTRDFRSLLREISMLMGYELLRDLHTEPVEIETPLETTEGFRIAGKKLCFVSIMRAGSGMVDGLLELVPSARVGHVGIYRDPERLSPVEYYSKLPCDVASRRVVVVDPMLATGNSAAHAVDRVKSETMDIKLLCLIACPEGIASFQRRHPSVPIYTAAIDRELNRQGYILPGLGDAGDRIFGTK